MLDLDKCPAPILTDPDDPYAGFIDADVHPVLADISDLRPWLPAPVWETIRTFGAGSRARGGYPKVTPDASRQDARPPDGGGAGTDYAFLRRQYLDPLRVGRAILSPLRNTGQTEDNPVVARAMVRAMNHWQIAYWTELDPRLKASILVPVEQPEAAAQEIDHWADNPAFAQVLLLTRTQNPLGHPRYWPIYEAAARHGFPVAVHVFGSPGHPSGPAGWPAFYLEDMTLHSAACQGMVTSMALSGLWEHIPGLKIVSVEGGIGWLPSLEWRLDAHFHRFRAEVPHLRRRPSEYLRQGFLVATQPMEEPEKRAHLFDLIEWIGAERILFSTDYPHWDFDDPRGALPPRLGDDVIRQICSGNALRTYRLS